jgi:hypothetical protein
MPLAFFFFFLPLHWATTSMLGLSAFPASEAGGECQAWPSTTLAHFVRQVEELDDVLHIMRGQLLEHLLVPHTLPKHNENRGIGNVRDVVPNLGEPLNEGAQWFPQAMLYDMEVSLIAWLRVCTLKDGHELMTQLLLGK